MGSRKPPSPALLALTGAALSLPGIARTPADEVRVDYRFSAYREGSLSRRETAGPQRDRYEIDTQQFRLVAPVGDFELGADFTYETMSGASPRFVTPGPEGPVQVMSGASIVDKRSDVLLRATAGVVSVSGGYSSEDDYRAANAGLQLEHELADRLTTLSAGIGYSDDKVEPTQGATPTGVLEAERDALTAFAGVARVLSADTVVQSSLSFSDQGGYLSDPYKEAFIVSSANTVRDTRPDGRRQWAWLTRLRSYFARPRAALHVDYRLYDDDWDITAHTVDLAWHQNVGRGLRLTPGARWYSQSQAFFYAPYYNQPRGDGFHSSDYRLSPYGAVSFSLAANAEFRSWALNLRYERYDSDADYALKSVAVENPGLVEFSVLSAGIKKTF